jgi:DUF4097 and DUF4098 domain-containing protein YvlB
MRTATKVWLIVAGALIALGIIVFGTAFMAIGGDMAGFSTNKYETNENQISDEFKHIFIKSNTANIKIVASEDESCSVVCYEQINLKHSVSVKDGALEIKVVDERKWYEHIGINFSAPTVTVYIPKGEYGDLDISVSTGDVDIPEGFGFENIDVAASTGRVMCGAVANQDVNITTTTGDIFGNGVSAASMKLSVSTGRIDLNGIKCEGDLSVTVSTGSARVSGVKCRNFRSDGDTGRLYLGYLEAEEKITVKRSTGDVSFDNCDAAELFIETSTGDVEGTLRSDKVFIVRTDTGDVEVPKTTSGGRCEITTDTGDIKIRIEK